MVSLETSSKDDPFNYYSAIVIACLHGKSIHVIDFYRKRMLVPALEDKLIELARLDNASLYSLMWNAGYMALARASTSEIDSSTQSPRTILTNRNR